MDRTELKLLAEELSNTPNSDDRWFELSKSQAEWCRIHDIVVVYGYSDDNVEFDGAFRDEVGAWEGAEIYLNENGVLEPCECECKYYKEAMKDAKKITAFWCLNEWCWSFKTDIPHEEFEFYSDGEPYCKGIVFYKWELI
jgi:hypothetical protein